MSAFLVPARSEEHTSELQSRSDLVCRLLLEKKKTGRQSHGAREFKTYYVCLGHGDCRRGEENLRETGVGIPAWLRGYRCAFFFNDTATTEIYTLSLHDALPI